MGFIVEKTYFYFLPKNATISEKGYKNALLHKEEWIQYDFPDDDINTYDRATTKVVHEGKVYDVFKDYVDITNKWRLYICIESDLETEND